MIRSILLCVLCALSLGVSAQEVSERDKAVESFADDLAALQAEVHSSSVGLQKRDMAGWSEAQYASFAEDMVQRAMRKAQSLRDKWKGNPYVEVDGFSVAFSVTGLEVSVDFEFK